MKLFFLTFTFITFIGCCEDKDIQFNSKEKFGTNTFVEKVYPDADTLPENILKFYIKFSKPMREGNFLNHIRLINNTGDNVSGVFFDNFYELWNNDRTQITLLVDPGRVKKGLQQNIKQGRAFAVNESYKLIIDSTWRSIQGNYIDSQYVKTFFIKEEDSIPPNIHEIKITPIKRFSKSPINITFNEVLDQFQLQDYVRIVSNELVIKGKFDFTKDNKMILMNT